MLQIYLNLPGQKFVDLPFEEEILAFMRELGHTRDIKLLTDVKIDTLHQLWRTFGTIINKFLSGKVSGLDQICLSRAQIIWGQRLNAIAEVAKSGKKKLPTSVPKAKGLKTLSDLALSEAEQMKVVTKRSKTDYHVSHTSGSGANKGPSVTPEDPNVSTYGYKDEKIYLKSSEDKDNDETKSDNDGDDFVHPKFSTHDKEERQDEEDKEEECFNQRVHTPSHYESTDDEAYDEVTQSVNVEEEKLDEEKTNKEGKVNEMYNEVNINLKRRDTKMTDAPQTNVQATHVIEDNHVIITAVTPEVQQQSSSVSSGFISKMLNPNLDTCIDSILNLNIELISLVDVPVNTNDEIPPSSVTTLPPPPIPLIQPLQQTPFKDRVKSLENDFLEFKQTNQFAEAISSIIGIVDKYLAIQMNKAVKAAVQLQSNRLREEAQADNEDFINKIDENIKKIIKEQVKVQVKEKISKILPRIKKLVNEQFQAEVLIRSSNEANTSHAIVANLSELELKRILIDKIENNKSIDRSVQQKNLYKALVDAYEIDKDILATFGDAVTFKRRRDNEDEDEELSAGSN
uniref:Uncharacterized protein n=1 Tax=Tanacetum cinerariifolium TaxID=118510 RepID=A0A699I6K5_TANCI|nr:hypothetical protein [Tanacetum cinerariifolium]